MHFVDIIANKKSTVTVKRRIGERSVSLWPRAETSREAHPFRHIMEAGIRTTVNTDDPGIMNIDIMDEYRLLRDGMGFTAAEFAQINVWGREACFIPEERKAEVWPD